MKNFWITRSTIFCGCSVDLRTQDDRKRCNFLLVHFVSGIMILMLEVCKNGFHFSNRFLHRSLLSELHFILILGMQLILEQILHLLPSFLQCLQNGLFQCKINDENFIHDKLKSVIRILWCVCFVLFLYFSKPCFMITPFCKFRWSIKFCEILRSPFLLHLLWNLVV